MRTFFGVVLGGLTWVLLSYGTAYALILAFGFNSETITFPWVAMCLASSLLAATGTGFVCAKAGGLKPAAILTSFFVISGIVSIAFRLLQPQTYGSYSVNMGNSIEYRVPSTPIWFNPLVTVLSVAVILYVARKVKSGPIQRTSVAASA
jgi:hypothetical protein